MKKILTVIPVTLLLASCNGWVIQPGPTPFLPPTNTPSIVTPTPVIIGAASATPTPQVATATSLPFITATFTPSLIPSPTPGAPQTDTPSGPAISVEVLGCNTSIDVSHGMGEVTNAFVVLRNKGSGDLTNLKATLKALDEGRVHPDKTAQVASLPVGYKVTLKLTVDSTYRQETPIQIEVSADPGLFERVGADSCKDLGLFAPAPSALNTPVPNDL